MEAENPSMVRSYLFPIVVVALFGIVFYPSINLLIVKWSGSDDYTHAFLIVPIAAYIVWLKRHCLIAPPGRPIVGFVLILFSVCFYLLALQLQVPTVIFLATVLSVISVFIYFGGFFVLKELGVPILLLFMVIPIPNQLLSMVTAMLQLKVSEVSELVIQLFAVPIFREGNILEIPGKAFQVVDACSGIRSLISLTTLGLIIGYFTLSRGWSICLLVLCAIPVAILINIIRVTSLVLVYHYWGIDLGNGTSHTIAGLVLFGAGLCILFVFQRLLELWEIKNKNS